MVDADLMDFGNAIILLKSGHAVARVGWNGRGMWLTLVPAVDAEPFPRRAFIAMKDATEHLVPWMASQTDMLAEDWVLVDNGR